MRNFVLLLNLITMKTNMGLVDRALRIVIALAIAAAYLLDYISGTLAIVLLVAAGIFILTSFIGTCPLYLPFGISTKKKN